MMHSVTSAKPMGFAFNDRAASYGDGVFTTMLVNSGKVALRTRHIKRLVSDAERLGIVLNENEVATAITDAAGTISSGVLKLLVSAGEGGRGYARDSESLPSLHFSHHPYPATYTAARQSGVSLVYATTRLASQPLLAGIKHLNRLEQVMVKRELSQCDADDALVCDHHGMLIEASAANVFWYQDGSWYTPDLSESGVSGVMRSFVIDWMRLHNIPLQVGRYSPEQCQDASGMMLTNALMELMPVRRLTKDGNIHHFDITPVTELHEAMASDYKESYA